METCELNRQVICPLPNFLKDFIYVILERGEGREKEGEKHQRVVASRAPPTGDLAHNPGMCPDWESNPLRFGSHRLALNPLSHTSQGQTDFSKSIQIVIIKIQHR